MSVVTFTVRVRLLDFGGRPRDGVKVLAAPIPAVKKTANAVHGTDPEDSVTNDTGLAILTLISIPGLWYRISGKGFDAVRFAAYFPDPSDPTTGTAFPQDYEIDFEDLVDESPTPGYEAIAFLAPGGYVLPAELDALDDRVVVLEAGGGGGGGGVTDHGALTGLGDDDHTLYALADGTRGSFAAPLGADDNYVTDAEKSALHAHGNKAALDLVSGTNTGDQTLPTWTTIAGKPAVVAEGATQADARTAIGAGTSSLVIGTGAGDAKAGNYQPTAANVSDSTTTGRALLTAADAAAARTTLGLGTAATTASTAYATAAQGTTADAALAAAAAPELIRDTMATALVAGTNVTITPNDGADTITIAASGGGGGGGVSADPGNTATLGTDNLIYVPKAIGIEPGASTVAPNVNINGRAGGNVNATTFDRVISHYNPEAFACDEIGLIHRSGNVSATYRLAIWSGYPNPGLVFTTPEFSVPTTGEATVVFTVPGGTVFPRGVWYIGFVLTSGTSGTFNSGGRNTSFEPNRDPNNAGALSPSNFGVVSLGWTPPATLTLDSAWAAGATPQLLAKNLRFV